MQENRPVEGTTEVCFVIPVGGRGQDYLMDCLRSIKVESGLPCHVVVVFDGPPSDALLKEVATFDSFDMNVIVLPEQRRAAAARNRGVASTDAPVIFFIDSDVLMGPGALRHALDTLTKAPCDAVFGAYTPDTPASGLFSKLKNFQHSFVHRENAGPVRSFAGGCSAVRREAFEEVGGFDEDLAFCEVIVLGIKLARAGKRILIDPSITSTHLKQYTFLSWLRSELVGRAIPWSSLILAGRAELGQLNTNRTGITNLLLTFLMLTALLVALWKGVYLYLFLGLLVVFTWVNRRFAGFVYRHGSLGLSLAVVPYLVLHYAIAGVGFGIAVFRALRSRLAFSK